MRMGPYSKTPGLEAGRPAFSGSGRYSAGWARAPLGLRETSLFQP